MYLFTEVSVSGHISYSVSYLYVSFSVLITSIGKERERERERANLSRVMKKPTLCICENKDADQLRGNREADQRLCFRYIDSTIPLLSKSKISSL